MDAYGAALNAAPSTAPDAPPRGGLRLAVGVVTAILGVFIVRHYPNGPAPGGGFLVRAVWDARS